MKKKTPDRHIQSVFSRKMLLVVLLLFPFSLVRAATEDSTRLVTFSTKAESLNHVLIKFKDQTGVEILFNRQLLGDQVCKELNLVKVSVDVALGKILEGTGFEFSKVDGVYIIKKKTKEKITRVEPRVVTGVVKDAQGEPLPGVTVVVKGTTLGCATDADGKYKLPISLEGDVVLVFSFVGMQTKEVTYKGEAELNITLEPDVTEIEQVRHRRFGYRSDRQPQGHRGRYLRQLSQLHRQPYQGCAGRGLRPARHSGQRRQLHDAG